MKVGFFIGCNIAFNRPDLEQAVRYTFPALGVELDDLEGQSCCPTWGTMPSIDPVGWYAVGARNFAIAEEKGVEMITACSTCYGSLAKTASKLQAHRETRNRVNRLLKSIRKEYQGTSRIRHVVYYLYHEIGSEKIKVSIKHSLERLSVAIQPGCLSLWPSEIHPEKEADVFHPQILQELCEVLGASAPLYSRLLDCCGMGGMRSTDMEKSFILVERKLVTMKKELNPDLIVTGCSSCLIQFDTAQEFLQNKGRINFAIPVLHYVQLLAVCLGAEPQQVAGLARTPVLHVLRKIREG